MGRSGLSWDLGFYETFWCWFRFLIELDCLHFFENYNVDFC